MKDLATLLQMHEDWLVKRVIAYAIEHDYAKYTSTLEAAWRMSVVGLTESIVKAVDSFDAPPELHPDDDFASDPVTQFGVVEAQRHRRRGVSLSMFLGMMKYFRQAYRELVATHPQDVADVESRLLFLERCFDRIEIAFCQEWANTDGDALLRELQDAGRRMTNEKNAYLTVFESVSDPIVILDEQRRIANLNIAAARLIDPSVVPGGHYYASAAAPPNMTDHDRPWANQIGGDIVEKLPWLTPALDELSAPAGEQRSVEASAVIGDAPRWFEVKYAPLLDVSQKSRGAVLTLRDITNRKRANAQLRVLSSALNAAANGVVITDRNGEITWVNPAFTELTGYTAEEAIGQSPRLLKSGLHKDEFYADLWRTIAAGQIWRGEMINRRKDGGLYVEEMTITPVPGDDGVVERFIAIKQDVSERKRSEAALRQERDFTQTVLQTVDALVVVLTSEGRIVTFNRACERCTGYSQDEVRGRDACDFLAPPEERELVRRLYGDFEQLVDCEDKEFHWVTRDGRKRLIAWSHAATRRADGSVEHVIATGVDVTERRRDEELRDKLEAKLQQAKKFESLGALAGGIAHDFNNLLVGVLGNACLIRERLAPNSPEQTLVDRIERAANRAAELAKQMLAYSGRGRFVVEPVNLSGLTREIVDIARANLPATIAIKLCVQDDIPPIEADAAQIRQVAGNLITNAKEAVGERPGVVTVRTGVMRASREYLASINVDETRGPGEFVYLQVCDNGVGMDEGTVARMFDPFFTTKFIGRGLGLATSLGVVRGHHGAIGVQSSPGRGTCFTVLLPIQTRGAETVVAPKTAAVSTAGRVVLVVDDEDAVRDVARTTLEGCGFQVLTACDGREAMEVFRTRAAEISAVLLDLTMPGASGEEVLRDMRRVRADVPVVVSSGYQEEAVADRFADARPDAFIQKPYAPSALREAVTLASHPSRSTALAAAAQRADSAARRVPVNH